MSTRHDRNFKSFDGAQENVSDVVLDPIEAGWAPGSWQDTCKFYKRTGLRFYNFAIFEAGTEDAVDIGTKCTGNTFERFDVSGGKYVLTLKSGSSGNIIMDWRIDRPGDVVDFRFGGWSSQNTEDNFSNVALRCFRADGWPLTYAYRLTGDNKPKFIDTKRKHLWLESLKLTAWWHMKYFWHHVLRRPDV